jgi:hypothetical protein
MPKNYTDGDFLSSTVLNNSTVHKMTGTEIAALTSAETIPGYLVYCTTTGDGKTINNLYQKNDDNTAWDVVGLKGHTHVDGESGGALSDTLLANIPLTLEYNKRWARASDYWITNVSTGTTTDNSTKGCVALATGTTSGGATTISDGGARKLNFAEPSAFETTLEMSSATNFQVKLGVRAEDINGGNLTPVKYGIEGCSQSGTVWLVFSSDGTSRSTLSTSANIVTGAPAIYRLECDPGTAIRFYVNGTLVATKTTNVPSTGTTGNNDLYRAGIKNSAAENKLLDHYGTMIVGGI